MDWISVEDRLPTKDEEDRVCAIIYRGNAALCAGYLAYRDEWWMDSEGISTPSTADGVTHFHLIPAPPGESDETD